MNNKKGFTLIELVIVIALLGILSTIGIPRFIGYVNHSRIAVDQANLKILNTTTTLYRIKYNITNPDVFEGIDTDEKRIEELVDKDFLNYAPEPQVKNGEFSWHMNSQKWLHSTFEIAEGSLSEYYFSEMTKSDFLFNSWGGGGGSTWSINDEGLSVTGSNGNDLLFIGNDKSEYTLTSNFKLNENTNNNGGLGIFFETILDKDNDNKDSGYILQFDRGYSEIVLRKRVDGRESSSYGGELLVRIGNRSTSTIENETIPYKTDSEWWESEKELSLTVKNSETTGSKLITVFLDGEVILNDYEIESDIQEPNNHSGFRAWGNQPATIYDLKVED